MKTNITKNRALISLNVSKYKLFDKIVFIFIFKFIINTKF